MRTEPKLRHPQSLSTVHRSSGTALFHPYPGSRPISITTHSELVNMVTGISTFITVLRIDLSTASDRAVGDGAGGNTPFNLYVYGHR